MSPISTSRTSRDVRLLSAKWANADIDPVRAPPHESPSSGRPRQLMPLSAMARVMWASGHNGEIRRAAHGYEPTREAATARSLRAGGGSNACNSQTCIQFNCPFWTSPNLAPSVAPITSPAGGVQDFLSQWQKIRAGRRPSAMWYCGAVGFLQRPVVPPDVAKLLNTDAKAVLAVIRDEARATGKCTLPVARIAERANIGRAKTRAPLGSRSTSG
jgi:hypothetical protein